MLGLVLSVLPGPLTIPPILLGLIILASEFAWADRLLKRFRHKAYETWRQVRRTPVRSSAVMAGGLIAALAVVWTARETGLLERVGL